MCWFEICTQSHDEQFWLLGARLSRWAGPLCSHSSLSACWLWHQSLHISYFRYVPSVGAAGLTGYYTTWGLTWLQPAAAVGKPGWTGIGQNGRHWGHTAFYHQLKTRWIKTTKSSQLFEFQPLLGLFELCTYACRFFLLNWWTNKPSDILEGFWTCHIMCYLVSARWSSPGVGGLVISKRTVPVSMSRILNLVKSIMWTFSSGEQR